MKNIHKILLISYLLLSCFNSYCQVYDANTLKAVWIFKFTHFIKWPDQSNSAHNIFRIGVLKDEAFKEYLEEIYSEYSPYGNEVSIQDISSLDSLNDIHILYIPDKQLKELDKIRTAAYDHSILLIGDSKGYAENGVHINFFIKDNKVRFEINESAMHDAGFFVSYKLLNIAKIVKPIPN